SAPREEAVSEELAAQISAQLRELGIEDAVRPSGPAAPAQEAAAASDALGASDISTEAGGGGGDEASGDMTQLLDLSSLKADLSVTSFSPFMRLNDAINVWTAPVAPVRSSSAEPEGAESKGEDGAVWSRAQTLNQQ